MSPEKREVILWVCPDYPRCTYYETECGGQINRHCPVTMVGDRRVHQVLKSPRLRPLKLDFKVEDVDSR